MTAVPSRTLLYVGGHPTVREALAVALGTRRLVVWPVTSLPDALDRLGSERPDGSVIDDDGLGEELTLEAVRVVPRQAVTLPVAVLASTRSASFPVQCVRAGATGYFTKETPFVELVSGLDRFLGGELVIDPLVARTLFTGNVGRDEPRLHLTPVERRVMRLAADGLLVKQIAHELGLSPLTVKNHLARIRLRLGATDKAHAVATAIRHGLLEEPTG